MENISKVAYLCDNKLVLEVEDVLVSVKYDATKNVLIGVDSLLRLNDSTFNNCKEVSIEVEKLYTTRYPQRVYYTVFRIVTGLKAKGYLLERFEGKSGHITFYLCRSFRSCLRKIDKLEKE